METNKPINSKKRIRKFLSTTLACTLIFSSACSFSVVKAADTVTFKTQVGGTYDGMPLFDGNPDHLNDYLNTYINYVGLEGAAVYATDSRGDYTLTTGTNKGKTIPGAAQAEDNVQGVSTDFPVGIASGQSWDKNLIEKEGEVLGNERLNTEDYKDTANFNAIAYTAVSDVRTNPLDGRIEECYSEDPYMAGVLADEMATGATGVASEQSNKGFWTKCILGTKHYSEYSSEWFRQSGDKYTSERGMMEYSAITPVKGVKSGAIMGTMTSYGRTNGIPNIMSPLINFIRSYSPYCFYTSPDATAYDDMTGKNDYSNGYDTSYAPDVEHALALYMKAHATAGGSSFGHDSKTPMMLVNAVNDGYYGVTEKDVDDTAKQQLIPLVRVGLFNERNADNLPIDYPYLSMSKGQGSTYDADTKASEDVALQTAQESVVLLKNTNNVLPLSKNITDSQKLGVFGFMADTRFKSGYSVGTTPDVANAGESPYGAIQNYVSNSKNVDYDTLNKVVAFRSVKTGKYLTATTDAKGDTLYTTSDTPDKDAQFSVYSWGQKGYSYLSLANNKWLNVNTDGDGSFGSPQNPVSIKNNGTQTLNTKTNPWDNALNAGASTLPSVFRLQNNADNSVSLICNGFGGGFTASFEKGYYNGQYLSIGDDGSLGFTGKLTDKATAASLCANGEKFEQVTVNDTAANVSAYKADSYAVVVVGETTKHSTGEGSDRSDLSLSQEQYDLVNNVAAQFPGKTIVVLKGDEPVLMGKIQDNQNVASIVYQPYAGEYDGYALAQVLFGDYAPTGRLTTTWYDSQSALPKISKYSIPDGDNATTTLDSLDPRYTTDMSDNDPIETGLTYMYTNAKTTYDFGYGLSYSNFKYSNLKADNTVNANGTFDVTVDVTNTGKVNTSDIVQLYIKNKASAYGKYAPKRKLVSFEKVALNAGETKTVTLTVDPQDFAVWNSNTDSFTVESGKYTLEAGESSGNILLTNDIQINGGKIGTLNASSNAVSVFDHSFASSNVVYKEVSKVNTVNSLTAQKVAGDYSAVMSKGKGAYVALKNVDLNNATGARLSVASTNDSPSLELRLDSPTGKRVALVNFDTTSPVTKTMADGTSTTELGYNDVKADFDTAVSGVHDLYIVFRAPDVRVNTLQISKSAGATYGTYLHKSGWQSAVSDGATSGMPGKGLNIEGLKVKLSGNVSKGASVSYETYVRKSGWQKAVSNGAVSGKTGKAPVDAFRITIKGLPGYQVSYRAYLGGVGWQKWKTTKSGTGIGSAAVAGSTSKVLGVMAVQVRIQKIHS